METWDLGCQPGLATIPTRP